ncbi:tape measure protein [Tropicimonas sp. IMCC34011]|uniref:tape measure protein n=1 Tax=Tropicimonas sp. IMCC34011 TaxID=2248759 RepID=UPI000E23ED4C|nr:tape measure protein [Tropicimonas sp. IMCC34011]
MIVDELIAIIGYDMRGEADRRRFEASLDNLNRKMNTFATVAGRAVAVAGAAVATGLGFMGRSVVNTAAQFEGFAVQLETIEGSAAKAEQSMDWISEFARTTPYEIAGLTDAFVRLKSQGIDPVADDAMRTLGDTASAMNKPLMQAVEAFTDASTFQFERLREFGITAQQAGDEVTFSYTRNGEQLQEVVKKNGEDVRRFLLDNFGERFSGAMDKQSRTFSGMVSNIQDSWTDFQRRIADAGFFDVVTGQLDSLLGWIQRMDEQGNLDRWAQGFSDAFTTVVNIGRDTVERLARHMGTLRDLFADDEWGPRLQAFAGAFAALAIWFSPFIRSMAVLSFVLAAIEDFLSYMNGDDSVLGRFLDWFKRWTGLVETDGANANKVLEAMRAALEGINAAADGLGEKLKSLTGFFDSTKGWEDRFRSLDLLPNIGLLSKPQQPEFDVEAMRKKLDLMVVEWSKKKYGGGKGGGPTSIEITEPNAFEERVGEINHQLGAGSVQSTMNDHRVTNNNVSAPITIQQTINQATDAPRAAAEATGQAVGSAVGTAARIQSEGAN